MPTKFSLGRTVATAGALRMLTEARQNPVVLLDRHCQGDWGDLCEEDQQKNEQAIRDGSRIFSAYSLRTGVVLWVITEADRSATTILLPEEY